MKFNFLFLISISTLAGNSFAAEPIGKYVLARHKKAESVPGEVLVKYKSSMSTASQKLSIEREGGQKIASISNRGWNRVKYQQGKDLETAIADYQADPDVEYAQPNYIYHTTAIPNDARFAQQWGFKNTAQTIVTAGGPNSPSSSNNPGTSGNDMGMPVAWDITSSCTGAVVAVIDTGINYNQADLAGNMWNGGGSYPNHGYNFVSTTNDPMDNNGHGTHVAGTIGAIGNNSVGGTGVCWSASLMAVKVLDATGSGTTANVVAGLNFAVTNGAKVVNMSLGGGSMDAAFSSAIDNARTNGVLVVVAAGNDGTDNDATPSYPCSYAQDNVLCVAALNQNYGLASFSNFGATSVDVGAPGVNIVSSWPGTHTKTTDLMRTGWTKSSASGSLWGYASFTDGSSALVLPADFNMSSTFYANNTSAKAWKSFTVPTHSVALLNFYTYLNTESGTDYLSMYALNGNADPIAGGTYLGHLSGTTAGSFQPQTYDISTYATGTTSSVGFNFSSDSANTGLGVAVSDFEIETLTYNTTSYNVISGTSMATPHVAGLAALIRTYNPNYTYAETIESIKNGGKALSVLSTNTTSGKAVYAPGSLAYIKKPIGVGAVKIP